MVDFRRAGWFSGNSCRQLGREGLHERINTRLVSDRFSIIIAAVTVSLVISAFYHHSATALAVDGEIVAAAQEERFRRRKHDAAFPAEAVAFCLKEKLHLRRVLRKAVPGATRAKLVFTEHHECHAAMPFSQPD